MELEHAVLIALAASTGILMAYGFAKLASAVRDVATMTREILKEIKAR